MPRCVLLASWWDAFRTSTSTTRRYQASKPRWKFLTAIHFPKDTTAKILTSGLLGEQYVGLDPGGDPDMLAAGDRITNTQSAVILENLIGQFLFNKAADGGTAGATAPADAAGTTPATSSGAGLPSPSLAVPIACQLRVHLRQGSEKMTTPTDRSRSSIADALASAAALMAVVLSRLRHRRRAQVIRAIRSKA